jgi:dimeric dUTPase (all-alpha-NTP-PPase superfamily)
MEKICWGDCENFIYHLKLAIPKEDRSYDSSSHEWTIHEQYLDIFQELRETHLESKEQQRLWDE